MRVLVTGAASGIGQATCLRLGPRREARGRSPRTAVAALDVQPSAELDGLVRELRSSAPTRFPSTPTWRPGPAGAGGHGGPGSAASTGWSPTPGSTGPGRWSSTRSRTGTGSSRSTRGRRGLLQAAHAALATSRGAVVAVASMSGIEPHAHLAAYGPSKAALIMLVRVLAQELAADGVRVNAVSPGMVRTPMTERVYADETIAAQPAALVPLGRVAGPDDIADVIAFLLSPDARYLNGHDLVVDGGLTGNFLGRLPGLSQITRA